MTQEFMNSAQLWRNEALIFNLLMWILKENIFILLYYIMYFIFYLCKLKFEIFHIMTKSQMLKAWVLLSFLPM